MKLEDLRRKAVSGIKPNRKVRKSRNSEVIKTPISLKCECGCEDFYYIASNGGRLSARCLSCGKENQFYHCANQTCYDVVRVNGLYCEKCKRKVITESFMKYLSEEV